MKTYKMTIAGLERELPICSAGEKLDIAAFVIFGDVEITVASAKALLEKCPEFDYIVRWRMRWPSRAASRTLFAARAQSCI